MSDKMPVADGQPDPERPKMDQDQVDPRSTVPSSPETLGWAKRVEPAGLSKSQPSEDPRADEMMSRRARVKRVLLYLLDPKVGLPAAVIAAVAVIAAAEITSNSSNHNAGSGTPTVPLPSNVMTVQDVVNAGTWETSAPTPTKLDSHHVRPAGAVRWVRNGTNLTIVCARPGAKYSIVNQGERQVWKWWAKVEGTGAWVAMAAFAQTNIDGSQGFRTCTTP